MGSGRALRGYGQVAATAGVARAGLSVAVVGGVVAVRLGVEVGVCTVLQGEGCMGVVGGVGGGENSLSFGRDRGSATVTIVSPTHAPMHTPIHMPIRMSVHQSIHRPIFHPPMRISVLHQTVRRDSVVRRRSPLSADPFRLPISVLWLLFAFGRLAPLGLHFQRRADGRTHVAQERVARNVRRDENFECLPLVVFGHVVDAESQGDSAGQLADLNVRRAVGRCGDDVCDGGGAGGSDDGQHVF